MDSESFRQLLLEKMEKTGDAEVVAEMDVPKQKQMSHPLSSINSEDLILTVFVCLCVNKWYTFSLVIRPQWPLFIQISDFFMSIPPLSLLVKLFGIMELPMLSVLPPKCNAPSAQVFRIT